MLAPGGYPAIADVPGAYLRAGAVCVRACVYMCVYMSVCACVCVYVV